VIGDLNRCLTARAESAVVDGAVRLSFQFLGDAHLHDACLTVADRLHVGFHDAGGHTAAGAAQWTHARLPLGNAWHQIFVRHEPNELMFRIPAARKRGSGPGDGGQLDEIAAVH
jgi:hypothetical protein